MKLLLFTLTFTAFSLKASADEMPMSWRLKAAGYTNCTSSAVFNESFSCGQDYAQVFICDKSIQSETTRVSVLALGNIQSDTVGACNPVRIIRKFIEAKNAE